MEIRAFLSHTIERTVRTVSMSTYTCLQVRKRRALKLNYTFKGASEGSKLPVMVYLHGGAFYSGTNDIDRIRGKNSARHWHPEHKIFALFEVNFAKVRFEALITRYQDAVIYFQSK